MMKNLINNNKTLKAVILGCCLGLFSTQLLARDSAGEQSISDAMATATAQSFEGVAFYFGDQPHPPASRSIGTYSSRRSTNAFGKSDVESCQWAFLSGIKTFYERALKEGGNAVVNIISTTTGAKHSSAETFMCRAGNVVSKVYLSGDVIVID